MPGLYSPVAGDVLTAANAISYWSKQVTIQCTSGTRPASPVEGMKIYQTDDDRELTYNGSEWVTTTPVQAVVATSQTTSSTSFTDLATAGPAVTVTTGTKVLVTSSADVSNGATPVITQMAPAVSGATTLAAALTAGWIHRTYAASGQVTMSATRALTGLTAGSNVFTSKYLASSNTSTFSDRMLAVQALP